MTIGRLMLVQAVASAAVLQSTAKSPGTFAGGWRPQPFATTVAIGRVVDVVARGSGDPLIYFRGGFLND